MSELPALEIHSLTASYKERAVLWGIDFTVPQRELAAIVGPNGAGKSTLLKALMGLLPIDGGEVRFFGEPLHKKRDLIAYVPQRSEVDWDFPVKVEEVVLMGRYSRLSFFQRIRTEDKKVALQCLERVGMSDFKDRLIRELSGGQQQRVFLARALAQEARLYVLDEPFAGIDAVTEQTLVTIFREITEGGGTVLCVHHDLSTIPEYFTYVALLNLHLVAAGPTKDVFTPENLKKAYGGRLSVLSELVEEVRKGGPGTRGIR